MEDQNRTEEGARLVIGHDGKCGRVLVEEHDLALLSQGEFVGKRRIRVAKRETPAGEVPHGG